MKNIASQHSQHAAALVFGLVFLLLITVLATAGMTTATTELAIARNHQDYETVFQAAESGLERAISLVRARPMIDVEAFQTVNAGTTVSVVVEFELSTPLPDRVVNPGSGVAAHHFLATAIASLSGTNGDAIGHDALAVHRQAFYVIGPERPQALAPDSVAGSDCQAGCLQPPTDCVGVECDELSFSNDPVRTLWTRDGIQ
jgi:Tfp pilus assembly protein PilX